MDITFAGVRLLVMDFQRSFRFYHEVLGLPVHWGDENSGYASFATNGSLIAIFGRQDMAEAVGQGKMPSDAFQQDEIVLGFEVASVDDTYRQLSEKGVVFVAAPTDRPDWGERTAHFRDPDGFLIEINHSLS